MTAIDSPASLSSAPSLPSAAAAVTSLRPRVSGVGERAPVSRLIAIDDDSDRAGEIFRLRRRETTLGRRDADILFPNDPDISGSHAAIARTQDVDGKWHWSITDCGSTNGVYLRVEKTELKRNQSLRLGVTDLRWTWVRDANEAILCEAASGREYRLSNQKIVTIGSCSQSAQIVLDDSTVNPVHASLECREGIWLLEDQMSRNGIWVRGQNHALTDGAHFTLGQQRFRFEFGQTETADVGGADITTNLDVAENPDVAKNHRTSPRPTPSPSPSPKIQGPPR